MTWHGTSPAFLNALLVAAALGATASAAPQDFPGPPPRSAGCMLLLPEGGTAASYQTNTWTKGLVYYAFDPEVTSLNQERVLNAMSELECVCGLQFLPWPGAGQPNYIRFKNSEHPYNYSSAVGMAGGPQTIGMLDWSEHYIIVHEIMHAVGFWHEQQRSDSGEYVTIIPSHMTKGALLQFVPAEGSLVKGPYDFGSLMHYHACAFSSCSGCSSNDPDCVTISVNAPWHAAWQGKIGQRRRLSDGDVQSLRFLYPAHGDPESFARLPIDTYEASFPIASHLFGYSISTKPGIDRAIIGAPAEDPFSTADSAYIVRVPDGQHLMLLTASDLALGAQFGKSVAIDVRRPGGLDWFAVVGAPPYGAIFFGDLGSIYVFDVLTGQLSWKLTAFDAEYGKLFGNAVAIDKGTIVVGSPYAVFDVLPMNDWGAAYVFRITATSSDELKLVPSDTAGQYAGFGHTVDVHDDVAIVGSPHDGHAGFASGSAYLFDAIHGQQLHKLTAVDAQAQQAFGAAVAIRGDKAFVGAPAYGTGAGAVYVFDVQTGTQLHKLTMPNPAVNQWFGQSLAVSGDILMVGAFGPDPGSPHGAAYLFDFIPGSPTYAQQIDKLDACIALDSDGFSFDVALNERVALVSSPRRDVPGFDLQPRMDAGSVYAFASVAGAADPQAPALGDLNGDGRVDGADLGMLLGSWGPCAPGCPADLNGDGVVDGNDLGTLLGVWG